MHDASSFAVRSLCDLYSWPEKVCVANTVRWDFHVFLLLRWDFKSFKLFWIVWWTLVTGNNSRKKRRRGSNWTGSRGTRRVSRFIISYWVPSFGIFSTKTASIFIHQNNIIIEQGRSGRNEHTLTVPSEAFQLRLPPKSRKNVKHETLSDICWFIDFLSGFEIITLLNGAGTLPDVHVWKRFFEATETCDLIFIVRLKFEVLLATQFKRWMLSTVYARFSSRRLKAFSWELMKDWKPLLSLIAAYN